jgi:hypothetical protein
MHHRLAVLGATATASLSLGLAVAVPANAAKYPSSVRQEYLKACKKAARSSGGGVSARDARVYCEVSLTCLQRNLTLKQFEKFDRAIRRGDETPPYRKVVNRCIKEAARAI